MRRILVTLAMAVALLVLVALVLLGSTLHANAGIGKTVSLADPQLSTICNSCSSCTSALTGGTYTTVQLTADISDQAGSCISLLSSSHSGLTFDCNGHTIDGDDVSGSETLDAGIEMYHGSNNTVQNCIITDFDIGIYFRSTTGHRAEANDVSSNFYGIWLEYGDTATLENNDSHDNTWGIYVSDSDNNTITDTISCQNSNLDIKLEDSTGNTGDNNTCDKPDGWNDQGTSGCTKGCAGTATCTDCADCTSKLDGIYETVLLVSNIYDHGGSCVTFGDSDVVFDCGGRFLDGTGGGGDGITISNLSGNTIRNCTVKEFYDGIYLYNAPGTAIENNEIKSNTNHGINLFSSDGGTISGNEIESNVDHGVYLNTSDNNDLTSNTMRCNGAGIGMLDTNLNSATANIICSSQGPDFNLQGTVTNNSGTGNQCDMPGTWNDGGASGCTKPCDSLRCSTCSDGIWGADEDGVDCGGRYCPPCSQCNDEPTNKYAPPDTICNDDWPTTDGVWTGLGDYSASCNLVEVCNPGLDYVIEDALLCCEYKDYYWKFSGDLANEKRSACYYAQGQAYRNNFDTLFNPTSLDQCLGHYIISSLERNAVYMQDYFDGELCCSGSGGCPDTCEKWKVSPAAWEAGTDQDCRTSPGNSVYFGMDAHMCESFGLGIFGRIGLRGRWSSDTDYTLNRDNFVDTPPHAAVNNLSTGTCADYSLVLTTLLRKAGYSKDRVLSVEGVKHAYNLVHFPGEAKWHYVDTTGNTAGGVFGGSGFPDPTKSGYHVGGPWRHCSGLTEGCMNDVYSISRGRCPPNKMIYGCEWVRRSTVQSSSEQEAAETQAILASPLAGEADHTCTELNPCLETTGQEAQLPAPGWAIDWDKTISSPDIILGQDVEINIQVVNLEANTVDILVQEILLPNVDYDLDYVEIAQDGNTIRVHQQWLEIAPGGSETLSYVAVPTSTGHFEFKPSALLAGAQTYRTDVVRLDVMCEPDGTCDPGESFVLCPDDCTTGLADGLCDMVADGTQDPDCEYGVDPDYFRFSDTDGDGKLDGFDACALTPAGETVDVSGCGCSQQICDDGDADTVDGCDPQTAWCTFFPDADHDQIADADDNCPDDYNPDQTDSDGDGTGDQCAIGPVDSDTVLDPDTYVILDPDSQGAIVIASSGVTLDCNGATIRGSGTGYGIYVGPGLESVTIRNCVIQNYRYGIFVDGAANTHLLDNRLEGNGYGLILGQAIDSIVTGNVANSNIHAGLYLEASTGARITGNTINMNSNRGIYLHTSPDNELKDNTVCFNLIGDFEVYDSASTGDGNACDVAGDWSDGGGTGCSEACSAPRTYLPLVLRSAP